MFQIKGPTAYLEVLMAAAAIGFAGTSFAENPADVSKDADINRKSTSLRTVGSDVNLQCGNKLLGMDVKDTAGEKIGTIKEIVLDSEQDRVDYAVLSHGGAAGIGAKNIAIPWSEFRVTTKDAVRAATADTDKEREKAERGDHKDHCLTVNVTKTQLDGIKGFSADNFPQQVGRNWQQEQMAEQPKVERSDAEKQSFDARRLSKLIGTEVRSGTDAAGNRTDQTTAQNTEKKSDLSAMGEKVGEIKDAILTENGQLAYAFVKLENFEGHNGELSTVPWSALMIHREPKVHAMLEGSKQSLGTFAFKEDQSQDQIARLAERDYSRQIFMAYDQGPQWEALGFVSPGEPAPGKRNPNQPGQKQSD